MVAKSFKWLLICFAAAACQGSNPAYRVEAATDGPRPVDTAAESRSGADLAVDRTVDQPESPDFAPGDALGPMDLAMSSDLSEDARAADTSIVDAAIEPTAPPPDLPPDVPLDLPPEGPGTALPTPVAYWRMDSATGNSTPDELGRNPGMLVNQAVITPQAATLMFGNPGALNLDGDDDYVTLGASGLPALNQPKSISVWFWTSENTSNMLRKDIVTVENLSARTSIHLGLEYGAVAVWTWASADARIASGSRATLQQWHHIGYTFDGQRHTLYADGTQIGNATFSLNPVPVNELFLGTYHPTDEPGERFSGRIDDVRIYDRALSATEMATLAQGRW